MAIRTAMPQPRRNLFEARQQPAVHMQPTGSPNLRYRNQLLTVGVKEDVRLRGKEGGQRDTKSVP